MLNESCVFLSVLTKQLLLPSTIIHLPWHFSIQIYNKKFLTVEPYSKAQAFYFSASLDSPTKLLLFPILRIQISLYYIQFDGLPAWSF